MARKASSKNLSSLADQVRSNLPNFLLGLTILIVFVLLSSLYFQSGQKTTAQKKQPDVAQPTQKVKEKGRSLWEKIIGKKEEPITKEKKYTVLEGDSLWMIAEKHYGSGFNAYDIARANKVENPDVVEIGTVLVLPNIKAKDPTKGDVGSVMTDKVTISGSQYVVKEGDSLWTIAQGAYGDSYAWVRIAQANSLQNPDYLEVGQTLSLPR